MSNTSLDSRGKLAAIAGVAPPLTRSFAHIAHQPLPPAMRELLRAAPQKALLRAGRATTEMTTRTRENAARGPGQSLAFYVGAGAIVLLAAALVRQLRA